MELESLIRRYVTLEKPSPKGFEACICQACNDYKPRGGFKFDGNVIGYHCFNCNYDTKFDANEYKTPSKKFKDLLKSFGIDESDITLAVGKAFVEHKQQPIGQAQEPPKWSPPKTIEPPLGIHLVSEDTSPWCEVARNYLKQRALEQCDYPFMVSEDLKLLNRLIIPYFHRDRLIYYQARSMNDDEVKPRYVNPVGCDKDKLIFNYDELLNNTGPTKQLYVTEGPLDALSIGPACALLGSTLSEWKLQELKKAEGRNRKIVFVIDKNQNGYNLGMQALKEGWHVAVMPDGVDDANHGLKRFGRLWLLDFLNSTSMADVAGQVMLRMKCK